MASRCPYAIGKILSFQLDGRGLVQASIINVFEPFTLSCAMIVQLDHPPFKGRFVLKIYDRRFAVQLRRDEKASPWSLQIESKYHQYISDGHASGFLELCTAEIRKDKYWAYDQQETWNEVQYEAYLQYLCRRTYLTENEAYEKLYDIQGKHVPRLFARPSIKSSSDSGPNNEYLDCPSILLEYIQGFPLTDLADNVPKEDWQYICEDAIRIVHLIGDRGVCNRDVKTRSFIIREDPQNKKFKVLMTDFGLCVFRSQFKSDREFKEEQANQDEEGAVGRVMQKKLKGGFNYVLSARAMWLLNEFKSE